METQSLQNGTLLQGGKYKIERLLGQGGFGYTYLAINTSLRKRVAIKEHFVREYCTRQADGCNVEVTVAANVAAFENLRQKFCKEARRLFDVSNSHVVRVLDLFDENGTSYYVMDYIEGESLAERLKRTGRPLREAEVENVLRQVLDALRAIHTLHIWHLDIKPGNIMIDKQQRVYLIDFGASKQFYSADGHTLSTSSAMAYTPGYAANEQMYQNYDKLGPWTDLYSLGSTLFNLLTNQRPPTLDVILNRSDAISSALSGVSERMRNLIVWMMKPQRSERPQSVNEVLGKLMNAHEQTLQPTTSTTKTLPSPKSTTKIPFFIGVIAFVLIAIGFFFLFVKRGGSVTSMEVGVDTIAVEGNAVDYELAINESGWTTTSMGYSYPSSFTVDDNVEDDDGNLVDVYKYKDVELSDWLLPSWAVIDEYYPIVGSMVGRSSRISSISYTNNSVYSGYTDDGRIFYLKVLIADGGEVPQALTLSLVYPQNYQHEVRQLIEMVRTWKLPKEQQEELVETNGFPSIPSLISLWAEIEKNGFKQPKESTIKATGMHILSYREYIENDSGYTSPSSFTFGQDISMQSGYDEHKGEATFRFCERRETSCCSRHRNFRKAVFYFKTRCGKLF